MRSIWKIKDSDSALAKHLSKSLNVHEVIAHLLINRGITEAAAAKKFLNPQLSDLHDPRLLKDMQKGIKRIKRAIKNKERVVIFGDYDVDGISATVLLIMVLKKMGLEALHYLPNRLVEGYGISKAGIEFAKNNKATLVVTVDCGISSVDEVKMLKRKGIDVVITDHHQPHKDIIPKDAVAVINPKQKDCSYPDKDICGVGVAFKLAQALTGESLEEHLDLVCLGTLADVVPLLGENRIFVKRGLEVLNNTKKIGLRALFDSARIKDKIITPYFVGYILGPRINAAGRLSSAEVALRLFLSEDESEAKLLAGSLEEQNRKRQEIEKKILDEALDFVDNYFDFNNNHVIVLDKDDWHRGVLGIVASKITDRYHRPTVVISWQGNSGRGSARSIRSFHLFDALTSCDEVLDAYGGHKYAAGLSITRKRIGSFRKSINDFARTRLSVDDLLPQIEVDAEVPISVFDKNLVDELDLLSPFGSGNPAPEFCVRGLDIKPGASVLGRDTLKFWVSDDKLTAPAIGFRKAEFFPVVKAAKKIDLIYTPSWDTWQGNNSIQLEIKDLRPA